MLGKIIVVNISDVWMSALVQRMLTNNVFYKVAQVFQKITQSFDEVAQDFG